MTTNAVFEKAGTAVTWSDTTGDLGMTLNNLAAGAGRQGAVKDWGALSTARETLFHYRIVLQFDSTPVVGEIIEFRWKGGDGSDFDNDDGTGDIAVSSENKLKNCKLIDQLEVDEAATGVDMSISGYFTNRDQKGMPILFNQSADNLVATNNVSSVTITPIFTDIQAAA